MARVRRSDEDFVLAAVSLVAEAGWAELSAKSLSERLEVHPTSIYRHFASWDDLIVAVFDSSIGELLSASLSSLPDDATPRERILALMRSIRAAAEAEPYIADCFSAILNSGRTPQTPNADAATAWIVGQLEEWGVPREWVPQMHQALETCIIGSILCDYAGHPDHVSVRRARRRMSGIPAFEESSRTNEACAQVADDAFELTTRLLLDECERLAAG